MNPITWFQDHAPSWLVELVSGLVVVAILLVAILLARSWWGRLLVCLAMSLYYERYRDPNGFSWSDVGQRMSGILLGLVAWLLWIRLP